MSIESNTVRPTSLEEVEKVMSQWMGTLPTSMSTQIRFSQASGNPRRLLMSTTIQRNLKFELTHDLLSCEVKSRKILLEVGDFDLRTEVDGKTWIVIFEMKGYSKLKTLTRLLDSLSRTEHPVFFSRAFNALSDITNELSTQGIEELTTASTDFELLVNALLASQVATDPGDADPLIKAKLRGLEHRKRLLEQLGGTLSVEEVADLIGISRQAVDKRRSQNHLIGLTQGRRGYAYPSFQFEDGQTLTGLKEVLDALSGHDPWMQSIFFANGNDRLDGKTPLESLRQGKLESVILAARVYGEQGAA
jgi:hypothetical protein